VSSIDVTHPSEMTAKVKSSKLSLLPLVALVIGAMIKLVPIADRRGTDKYGCALTAVDFGGLESYPDRAPAARRHLEGARCNPT